MFLGRMEFLAAVPEVATRNPILAMLYVVLIIFYLWSLVPMKVRLKNKTFCCQEQSMSKSFNLYLERKRHVKSDAHGRQIRGRSDPDGVRQPE